jgi:hypothetical protein
MSKIVKAINVMISNQNSIGKVIQGCNSSEIFFLFGNKHKWSIVKNDKGEYFLHYYPGKQTIENLASLQDDEWHEFSEMVSYNTKELAFKEAYDSFSELYTVVKEKLFNMDKVLDDIISKEVMF